MSYRFGTLGRPRPQRTSDVHQSFVPAYPTHHAQPFSSQQVMTHARPARARVSVMSAPSSHGGAATQSTVISKVREAKRRALLGRLLFGFLFVANAIMLGTILGLMVAG